MIRANNVFILSDHIIKFELVWREERYYLDVEIAPRAFNGEYTRTSWAFLTAYQVPENFDFEAFLNTFWREIRQGRHVNIADLVYEVNGGVR